MEREHTQICVKVALSFLNVNHGFEFVLLSEPPVKVPVDKMRRTRMKKYQSEQLV